MLVSKKNAPIYSFGMNIAHYLEQMEVIHEFYRKDNFISNNYCFFGGLWLVTGKTFG